MPYRLVTGRYRSLCSVLNTRPTAHETKHFKMSLPSSGMKHTLPGTSCSGPQQGVFWFARSGRARRCSPGACYSQIGPLVSLTIARWPGAAPHARATQPTAVLASHTEPASSKPSKSSNNKISPEDSIDWTRAGVPVYLQSTVDFNICGEESQALTLGRAGEMMWKQIR